VYKGRDGNDEHEQRNKQVPGVNGQMAFQVKKRCDAGHREQQAAEEERSENPPKPKPAMNPWMIVHRGRGATVDPADSKRLFSETGSIRANSCHSARRWK